MLTIRCHRETASASAPIDASVDTSVAVSPCAWPAQRTAALMTPLELQALIQRCTGQALEASHPVSAVAIGAGGPVLAYAEIVGGDAGARSLIALVDSPPVLSAWAITDSPAQLRLKRFAAPAMHARFDTLLGETVIVDTLTTQIYGFNLGAVQIPWERVWLKRGKTLVEAGRYALASLTDGEKSTEPTRKASAKALFHADRVELREDVTWTWYKTTYSDINGEERVETARVTTVFEHGFTLRGDKLEPDTVTETKPKKP